MEHTVEDIRKEAEQLISNIWIDLGGIHAQGKEIGHKDLDRLQIEYAEKFCNLFSTLLDGLVMEERRCSAGILCDQDQCCDGYDFNAFNDAVREQNAKISTIQRELGKEKA